MNMSVENEDEKLNFSSVFNFRGYNSEDTYPERKSGTYISGRWPWGSNNMLCRKYRVLRRNLDQNVPKMRYL